MSLNNGALIKELQASGKAVAVVNAVTLTAATVQRFTLPVTGAEVLLVEGLAHAEPEVQDYFRMVAQELNRFNYSSSVESVLLLP